MSFFKNLFGSSDIPGAAGGQGSSSGGNAALSFGRYTDANKSPEQVKKWDESLKLFTDKRYADAHETFFHYLRDAGVDNVQVSRSGDRVDFSLHQGSKVIKGFSQGDKVTAEVNIARFEKASVAFMRKLMDLNFSLQYSKFALKDDLICMKFSSYMLDASPNKLYYSLKEICTKADRHDNLLVEEFKMLQAVDQEHVTQNPDQVKEIKYKYLVKWVNDAMKRASELDEVKFGGAISFLLLNVAYKIDYLICPEGGLMNDMEKIHGIYFAKDNKPFEEKNRAIIDEYKKILAKPKDYFFESFYSTRATFGIMAASDQKQVADTVFNECGNTTWYANNNYPDIVRTIYEYIPGYCLFNFGMYRASIGIMHLMMEIMNQDFFAEIGMPAICDTNGIPVKSLVDGRIALINQSERAEFPNFNFVTTELKYTSLFDFCASFYKEVDYMNFSKQPNPQQN
ncbi:MAG: hypothetical protein FD123_1577 [Bacteroidetes bacterium]|nr:MAG: hypothetical protein FD123_1577 [Bacteroidota bacterium]